MSYFSAEVLLGTPYDVYKNDIWSLGVLSYIVMTKIMPFREDSNNNSAIVEQQMSRSYQWPHFISMECQISIDRLLTFDQHKRPTASDAKALPFFTTSHPSTNELFLDGHAINVYA